MNQKFVGNGRNGIYYLIALFGFAALVLLMLAATGASADDYELPPREDDATTPSLSEPVQATGGGALVHLQAHFSQDWPWDTMHWQEDLLFKVQWLDAEGNWQDVEGWQGSLDAIQQAEDWMGMKEIWLADVHLGTGPYRWQAYERHSERLLITSDEFYLPSRSGDLMAVEMMLKP